MNQGATEFPSKPPLCGVDRLLLLQCLGLLLLQTVDGADCLGCLEQFRAIVEVRRIA
ncbi:MAG: hypothetical protein SFW36_10880 [Leptolyngbyaceae cyanobacterium bins.59]|nr:hypothetical protein [Leptolyngbyaceae cyanobacterium bins.59]